MSVAFTEQAPGDSFFAGQLMFSDADRVIARINIKDEYGRCQGLDC